VVREKLILPGDVGTAFAVVGQVPINGFAAVDGTWLNGLANGLNYSYHKIVYWLLK